MLRAETATEGQKSPHSPVGGRLGCGDYVAGVQRGNESNAEVLRAERPWVPRIW